MNRQWIQQHWIQQQNTLSVLATAAENLFFVFLIDVLHLWQIVVCIQHLDIAIQCTMKLFHW